MLLRLIKPQNHHLSVSSCLGLKCRSSGVFAAEHPQGSCITYANSFFKAGRGAAESAYRGAPKSLNSILLGCSWVCFQRCPQIPEQHPTRGHQCYFMNMPYRTLQTMYCPTFSYASSWEAQRERHSRATGATRWRKAREQIQALGPWALKLPSYLLSGHDL